MKQIRIQDPRKTSRIRNTVQKRQKLIFPSDNYNSVPEWTLTRMFQVAAETEGNIALSAHTANVGLALLFLASTANTLGSRQLRQLASRTLPKFQFMHSQKWNCAASFPVHTFMYLWAIYIFPPSAHASSGNPCHSLTHSTENPIDLFPEMKLHGLIP